MIKVFLESFLLLVTSTDLTARLGSGGAQPSVPAHSGAFLWSLWEQPLGEGEKRLFSIWAAAPEQLARRLSMMLKLALCGSTNPPPSEN